jgi:Na+/glutamate symporter
MDKKIQLSILSIFVAAALVGSIVAISGIDNQAFAGGDGKKKKSNESAQVLSQNTTTAQASACESLDDTTASCNNLAFSVNLNDGNNAAGQQ